MTRTTLSALAALALLAATPASAQSAFPTFGTPLQKFLWARDNLVRFCNIIPGPQLTFRKLPVEFKMELAVATEDMVVERVVSNCSTIHFWNTSQ